MRPLLRTPLALLAMFASVAAASSAVVHADPSGAGSGIGVSLVNPVVDPADPRTQTAVVGAVDPGATIQRTVRVWNNTGQAQAIDVYTGAASEWNSQFTVADRGTTNRLTAWNSVDKPHLQLSSGQTADVTVTVAVPADAPVGNQYAAIWAQPVTTGGGGVSTESRAGVREYVTVGAGAGQTSDFQIRKLTGERDSSGRAVVVADVHNSGTRGLDLESALTLTGTQSIGPVQADRVLVAAGADATVRFLVPGTVADGPWQAQVTSRAGSLVRTLSGSVTFGTSGGSGSAGTGSLDFGSLNFGS